MMMFTIFDLVDVDGKEIISEDNVTVLVKRGTEGKRSPVGLVLKQDSLPVDVKGVLCGRKSRALEFMIATLPSSILHYRFRNISRRNRPTNSYQSLPSAD
jgi:hypothetical protein